MKKTTGLLLAAALAAAPLSLDAQRPDAPAHRGSHGGMMRGPGVALTEMLREHAEPALSADQVARLEAIEAELRARNEPLRQQLQALRPEGARAERPRMSEEERRAMREGGERPRMTDEQRAAMRAQMDQVRPIARQMADNARSAMERAREVLTAEQRASLERRMQERRSEMRERRGERGGRGMRAAPRGERAPRTR